MCWNSLAPFSRVVSRTEQTLLFAHDDGVEVGEVLCLLLYEYIDSVLPSVLNQSVSLLLTTTTSTSTLFGAAGGTHKRLSALFAFGSG